MDLSDKRQPDSPKKIGVKPYSKPRLEVYGGLSELTGHVGERGNFDSSQPHPSPNKTSV